MRSPLTIFGVCLALAGCAVDTERQSLGYGDYVALSCDQLGQETVNLMRAAADRSHHVLADDQARRERARKQLDLVNRLMPRSSVRTTAVPGARCAHAYLRE